MSAAVKINYEKQAGFFPSPIDEDEDEEDEYDECITDDSTENDDLVVSVESVSIMYGWVV